MAQTATTQLESNSGHQYDQWLVDIQERYAALDGPVFMTASEGLWEAYLDSFPLSERQFHNCSACRHFIRRYGGLVSIDEKGRTVPVVWNEKVVSAAYQPGAAAMAAIVRRAKVRGVLLSRSSIVGQPRTGDWTHFALELRGESVHESPAKTAFQAMAEKAEDHRNVMRALADFSPDVLSQALRVLESEALYRAEKVLGPARWLSDLHAACANGNRSNIVWRWVARAPAGFCHPRASMIGTLIEDIASGMDFDTVSRRFKSKMSPLQYRRPQAAPAAATIAQAEALVEKLGIKRSLERRFARLDELQTVWRPAEPTETPTGGVFAHLKPRDAKPSLSMDIAEQQITWEKFARVVLPQATAIDTLVPYCGAFTAIVTAVHADAPPILQWDTERQRNPCSLYLYVRGSMAHQWGLSANEWRRATAITLRPSMWFGANCHHGRDAILILDGARDSNPQSLALFPETLKSELHSVRSVVEAHSRSGKLLGSEEASACGLIIVNAHVRVADASGNRARYHIDRWD